MTPDLQKANDMLSIMQEQRDHALNAVVIAQADVADLKRQLVAKDAELSKLKVVGEPQPLTNGAAPTIDLVPADGPAGR